MAKKVTTAAEKKHQHEVPKPCEHELKHCATCDTVYCVKCGKEWKVQNWAYTSYGSIGASNFTPTVSVYNTDTHTHDAPKLPTTDDMVRVLTQ